jgi:hypothetical protein
VIATNRWPPMKYWEIIANNLSKRGWSWGCSEQRDGHGRTIFTVDAHRDDGKRFIVRADGKRTAFFQLEKQLLVHVPSK